MILPRIDKSSFVIVFRDSVKVVIHQKKKILNGSVERSLLPSDIFLIFT